MPNRRLWVALALVACTGKAHPDKPVDTASDAAPAPVKKPRGWKAYKERIREVEGFGPARDGEVAADDGSTLVLGSAWKTTYAVIVFYRGHW